MFFRPLVGYGGGSSDDDNENDVSQNKSREGSLPHDRNFSEMTEERRAKLREIEVIVPNSALLQVKSNCFMGVINLN